MTHIIVALGAFMLIYFAALNLFYMLLTTLAASQIGAYRHERGYVTGDEDLASPLTPGISMILPAFNEAAGIGPSVLSLLQLRYPKHEVLVVNDGSTDMTLDILKERFSLFPVRKVSRSSIITADIRGCYASRTHPNLFVIDKANGGKADAINAGINLATFPYFCAVDADALLEQDALLRVAKPLIDYPDEVAAAGGIVRIVNGCQVRHGAVGEVRLPKSRLAVLQVVEYFRAFLVGRVGWARLHGLLIISGAFGVFRRSIVEEVGGYATDTVGEDMELVMRMHRYLTDTGERYRIEFVADPVCWTEAPEDLRVFARQRRRWQRGLAQCLWRHRDMFGRARYRSVGLLAVPYFWLFELIGPVISTLGYVSLPVLLAFDMVSTRYMLAFGVLSVLVGVLLSVSALALEEWSFRRHPRSRDVARMLLWGVLENFGYRQMNDLLRTWALLEQLRGKQGWGTMTRKGLERAET